ncbi:Cers5 [Scenedesmus sp. PABB004]|nr:Cers5 [Scenedesmus sp. PABB004]
MKVIAYSFNGVQAIESNSEFVAEALAAAPGKKFICLCEAGGTMRQTVNFPQGKPSRSLQAAYKLLAEGGAAPGDVVHLERGLYGWYQADLPIVGDYTPDLGRTPMAAADPTLQNVSQTVGYEAKEGDKAAAPAPAKKNCAGRAAAAGGRGARGACRTPPAQQWRGMERLGALQGHSRGPASLTGDPLWWVLPSGDSDYAAALRLRAQHREAFSRFDGLWGSVGLCVAFLSLRLVFNNAFKTLTRARCSSKERQQLLDKIEEEIWVTLGGSLLLVAGWQCLASVSGYCGVHDTAGCYAGWPLIPVEPNVHKYFNVELGWYFHLMLKHALGLGLADTGAMGAHHLATVALIVTSYLLNVHLVGLLVFGVLNLSSPLLHLSKLASNLEMRRAKTGLFAAFAAVFFVTRVLVFPYVVLKGAVHDAPAGIRAITQYFWPCVCWLGCNALLLVLCGMQFVWFKAVLRVLRAALKATNKELEAEMASADPAGTGAKAHA